MHRRILPILFILFSFHSAQAADWLEVVAEKGDGTIMLLSKYMLYDYSCNEKKFYELNGLKPNAHLLVGKKYKLPIKKYAYNGKSIRSTIGKNDWEKAIRIKSFNELLLESGLRQKPFVKDNDLWVPYHELACENEKPRTPTSGKSTFPIFGKKYAKVKPESARLQGKVFYIVGGHGGPDPGAIGDRAGHKLCEDEYGYDVALRLARKLIANGAIAHVILRDQNDGIRDGLYLKCDSDEKYLGNKTIHRSQIPRLQQRADIINELYLTYKKKGYNDQVAVMLHIDSRNKSSRTDVFFYHAPNAITSEKMANTIKDTFVKKYRKYQANKTYKGTVTARDLFMLVNVKPNAVYLELANIKNPIDQKRLVLSENRAALAKWITDGFIEYYK